MQYAHTVLMSRIFIIVIFHNTIEKYLPCNLLLCPDRLKSITIVLKINIQFHKQCFKTV